VRYTTLISKYAARQIAGWGLSESVWMEVLLRLYQVLSENPSTVLSSLPEIPGGMLYYFDFPDPERPDLAHEFVFLVRYLPDEEHILVVRGSYWRHVGGLPEEGH
jgi:hypothetical protein